MKKKSNITREHVIALRKAANLTQAEAAEMILESTASWVAMEKGRRIMSEAQMELFKVRVARRRMSEELKRTIVRAAGLGLLTADSPESRAFFANVAALCPQLSGSPK